jgi:hypothetical protein
MMASNRASTSTRIERAIKAHQRVICRSPGALFCLLNTGRRLPAVQVRSRPDSKVAQGSGCWLGSQENAILQLPASTLQLSSTAIWLLA